MTAPLDAGNTRWLTVCDEADVFEGTGRRFELPDLPPIAVFNVAGQFHVTDDTCSHGNASLADGWLDGDQIECPFHQGKICVRTGEPRTFPIEKPIRVYTSRLAHGKIQIAPDRADD